MLSGSQQPHAYVYLQGLAAGGSAAISGVQGLKRFNTPVFCVVLCSGWGAGCSAGTALVGPFCPLTTFPSSLEKETHCLAELPVRRPCFRARPDSEGRSFVFEADDLGLW